VASVPSKVAVLIVATYPRTWRERYADEMLALIEDRGARWRDVIDLGRACCGEWRRTLADPQTDPAAFRTILTIAPLVYATFLALGFQAIAGAAAPAFARSTGTPPAWISVMLLFAPLVVMGRLMPLGHGWFVATTTRRAWLLTWPETCLWISLLFGAEMSLAWRGEPFSRSWNLIVTFPLCAQLLANTGDRGRRLHAYTAFRKAQREFKIAKLRLWREQARPLIFPNHFALSRAQAELDRVTHELDLARDNLRRSELEVLSRPDVRGGQ
jgi:hypothetical protein